MASDARHPRRATRDDDLCTRPSGYGAAETVARAISSIRSRDLELFAVVDHAAAAARAGLTLSPATVLLFGSPNAGTGLMRAVPTIAIDLPLRLLIWEGPEGAVHISYNDPEWIGRRHQVSSDCVTTLKSMSRMLEAIADEASGGRLNLHEQQPDPQSRPNQ